MVIPDPAHDYFEGHCGSCQYWQRPTTYALVDYGRLCLCPGCPSYRKVKLWDEGMGCGHFLSQEASG